jgi:hypothetical protein
MKFTKEAQEGMDEFRSVEFKSIKDLINKTMHFRKTQEFTDDTSKIQAVVIYDFIFVTRYRLHELLDDDDINLIDACKTIAINLMMHIKGADLKRSLASLERVLDGNEEEIGELVQKNIFKGILSLVMTADIASKALDDEEIEKYTRDVLVGEMGKGKEQFENIAREEMIDRVKEMFKNGER